MFKNNLSDHLGSAAIIAVIEEIDRHIESLRVKNDTATLEDVGRNQGGIRELKSLRLKLQPKVFTKTPEGKTWDVNMI